MTQGTAIDALERPVIILVGHSGSGKSEVAVNLALGFKEKGRATTLIDLDLVKPYFRSRLLRDSLGSRGIDLVLPGGDRLYADTPIVPPEVRRYISLGEHGPTAADQVVIIDVGGNDNGARVLGSLARAIRPDQTDLLFVVNANRPLTGNLDAMVEMVEYVSAAAGLEVTGLVSNTHLMDETTPQIVRAGLEATLALSDKTGVPVRFHCVPELLPSSSTTIEDYRDGDCPALVLARHILPPHARPPGSGPAGVL